MFLDAASSQNPKSALSICAAKRAASTNATMPARMPATGANAEAADASSPLVAANLAAVDDAFAVSIAAARLAFQARRCRILSVMPLARLTSVAVFDAESADALTAVERDLALAATLVAVSTECFASSVPCSSSTSSNSSAAFPAASAFMCALAWNLDTFPLSDSVGSPWLEAFKLSDFMDGDSLACPFLPPVRPSRYPAVATIPALTAFVTPVDASSPASDGVFNRSEVETVPDEETTCFASSAAMPRSPPQRRPRPAW